MKKYYTSGYQEHENIKYGSNKPGIYELDKLSLDYSNKEWSKRVFERNLENIYNTKFLNDMNFIHDNTINNIDECNSPYDILNPSKHN